MKTNYQLIAAKKKANFYFDEYKKIFKELTNLKKEKPNGNCLCVQKCNISLELDELKKIVITDYYGVEKELNFDNKHTNLIIYQNQLPKELEDEN